MSQDSAIGPTFFVVNAAELTPATAGNLLAKYADGTYLIVPATNSRALELDNIETWAKANNLALNRFKTVEIVITDEKRKRPRSGSSSEWVSSFLTAHQHIIGYSVPYNGLENAIKDGKYNQGYLATIKYE